MNNCSKCAHYDAIRAGTRETAHGWCVKRSLYPYADAPGKALPAGAVRVEDPESPAKPFIVEGAKVQPRCPHFTPKQEKLTKAQLLAKARGKR